MTDISRYDEISTISRGNNHSIMKTGDFSGYSLQKQKQYVIAVAAMTPYNQQACTTTKVKTIKQKYTHNVSLSQPKWRVNHWKTKSFIAMV